MTEVIMVPFAGEGAGTGELTWGQQHIWGTIQALNSTMNMCATRELSADATVAEFVDELGFYASRFQAMRTLLQFVPDGLPRQVVVASGEIPLEIVDVPAAQDPAAMAEELVAQHKEKAFDYAVEFPIRMILVRRDGVLTHLVTVLSHFATDAGGALAMYNAYIHRDPQTGETSIPLRMQSLELAAQQRTPSGKRQNDASLRYWEDLLRTIPMSRPHAPVESADGRFWQVELDSPAMFLAVQAIASRTEVDISSVVLGVTAVALARVTGISPSVAQMLVSNRFRPGLADIVSNISQTGLFVVDVTDITVDEAIVRTRQATVKAYKHAYFDLPAWKDLIARVSRERGGEIELSCYYNDRPSEHQPVAVGSGPTRDEIEAAVARTGPMRWTQLPFFNERLMVTIDYVPNAIALMVVGDTHFVPRVEVEELARQIESIAVASAFEAGLPTAVAAASSV
jgi:hypothetical protein